MPDTSEVRPPIKAVLFDKDGTLLDFNATWVRLYEHAAAQVAGRIGNPELADAMLSASGMEPESRRIAPSSALATAANDEIAAIWAETAGLTDTQSLAAELESLFAAVGVRQAAPVAGLSPALAELAGRGLVLGVATMDSEAMAEADLEMLGIRSHFQFVCGADSGFGYKPGPGMVEAFCEFAGVMSSEVAMVGDTTHDLKMGCNARAGAVVGVLTGAGDHATLAPLSEVVLAGIAELPGWLDQRART